MKAKILHESRGRMRLQFAMKRMSMEQADLLDAWLKQQPWIEDATVHDRTCCVILYYNGNRQTVIRAISEFSWDQVEDLKEGIYSTRKLDREFQERLTNKLIKKFVIRTFMPAPFRAVQASIHAIPFLRQGLRCVRRRQMKVELLDGISIGISILRRDFRTAGMVAFLLEIGDLLEEWTRKRSIENLAHCMSLNVDRVWIRTEQGEEILTPISNVHQGDQVIVRMGNIVPADGIVVEGEVMVNQSSLTGESVPVAKRVGGVLYAGTVVEEGECIFEVRQTSGNSRYAKIVSMIEDSQQLKSEAESHAENLADKLVPYTFAGSILGLVLTRNVTRALSVLMVDFSCALKLAMPLAVLSAMREAGKHHITVKGGKFLEQVARADTIVFDKTGTLTYACPKVAKVIPFDGRDSEEMLRLAACMEEHFPHSLANAVVEEAKKRGLEHEEFHTKVEYLVAHGITSTVNGECVQIGSAHFIFEDEGCVIAEEDKEKFEQLPLEYSHLYLAIGGKLVAVICICDPLREEASKVIRTLQSFGVKKTVMLTGDSHRTAEAIAKQLGVDDFRADVLPEDKADYITKLREEGHTVIMVGDGINDSPALSAADVGIAINHGAALAKQISDITISGENLWELVELRLIAKGLIQRLHKNYRFVIGFNGMLIILGLFGVISPTTSAALHNFSTLGISLHSTTALPEEKEIEQLKKDVC